MRNVEIKANVQDLEALINSARKISGSEGNVLSQHDIFYNVSNGRLKLRNFDDKSSTLVRYNRDDVEGPKLSDYDLIDFSADERKTSKALDAILSKSLGIKGHLKKKRTLFLVGQTRIHVDVVENLGNFMELEVVLTPEQSLEEGQIIAKNLQQSLGVKDEDLIDCAYIDLLQL